MINLNDYQIFRRTIQPRLRILSNPNYHEYIHYENLWEDYIRNTVIPKLRRIHPNRIGIMAMESAPGGMLHPHTNYIFNSVNNVIGPNDSYLKAFYNGSHRTAINHSQGLTKQQCLDGLLGMSDHNGVPRPLVLLDLFPSHGIKLNTSSRKRLAGVSQGSLSSPVSAELKYRMDFIYTNVLIPLRLTWKNVQLKFACPPTSQSAEITQFISQTCPGIILNGININTIGNGITPNANTLRSCIYTRGF